MNAPPRKDPFVLKSPRNIVKQTMKNTVNQRQQQAQAAKLFERNVQPLTPSVGIFERNVQPLTKKRKSRKNRKTRKGRK
jgi:hypothetical protein